MNLVEILLAPTWWMLLAGLLAAVGLFIVGNARLDNRLRFGSVGVVVAVIAWWGVGAMVETPTEAARNGTKRFVAAVVQRDTEKMLGLMAPAATLGAFSREDIAAAAKLYAEEFGLVGAAVLASEVEPRGSQLNCTIRVISRHEGGRRGAPDTLPTDWQFTWGRLPQSDGGGWRIVQITPIRVGNQEVSGIIGRYFTRMPRAVE